MDSIAHYRQIIKIFMWHCDWFSPISAEGHIDPTQCRPNYTADIRKGVAIEYTSCEPPENLKELFPEGYDACDDSFEGTETGQA